MQRFWDKVNKTATCWLWTGYITPKGYGQLYHNGKTVKAHRLAYGSVPEGLQLDHLCRVRHCVNPQHLEPVTGQVNVQRGILGQTNRKRGAQVTHCPRGHEYNETNTTLYHNSRKCKACGRERWHRRKNEQRPIKL